MNTTPGTSASAQQQVSPRRKLNPDPKRAYRITLKIANAPGPFASVEGVAQYDVDNDATCGKINPDTGVAYRITSNEPFALSEVSPGEYRGTVYTDLILDEDYEGRGTCRWTLTDVRVRLRATGDEAETRFVPNIEAGQVLDGRSVTKHFWKARYPRSKTDDFPSFGEADRGKFSGQINDEDLFTMTLSAMEAQP